VQYLTELVISGLAVGAIYGLIGMAYAVIYKSTGLVNFAQGEVGMVVAYTSWSLSTTLGTGTWGVIGGALVIGVVVGLLIERLVMRPMLGEPVFSGVMVTIGLAVVLRSVVQLIWGAEPYRVEGGSAVIHVGDIGMRLSQLGVFATLLFMMLATWIFFKHGRFGMAMRAVAADEKTARLMGISTARVQSVAWVASSVLAGMAGLFFAVIYDLSPVLAASGLKAFPATVLGGLDAVIGSGFSGLIIGVIENLAGGYFGSTLKEVIGFLLILVVLMVRPFGMFGEREIERV
jgi:branched-chain amino acid transport system permease protein